MSTEIDITGLDRADLLRRLFNAARPGGGLASVANAMEPDEMSRSEAMRLMDGGQTYIDYHRGRVLKCDVTQDRFRTALYDRDNGAGEAERVIDELRRWTAEHRSN